jgi:hypothetical protein
MKIAGFGWRHASAVALFAAASAAVPAMMLRPDTPARPAVSVAPAGPAEPATQAPPEPTAEPTPVPVRVAPEAAIEQATIPMEAFLQPPDTGAERHERLPWYTHVLPELCGFGFASHETITLGGHVLANYHPGRAKGYIPNDTFHETIATYRAGGAARFMRELRAAVDDCPVNRYEAACHPSDVGAYALVRAPAHGDEAIVVRITYPEVHNDGPTGKQASRLYLAVRVGDTVMVLAQQGYEFALVEPETFHEIGRRAVVRLTTWLRR